MKLSLLDRSRTRNPAPDGEALQRSVQRAVRVEQQGYHRFWAAEHHAVPGIASGSPSVLLAAVGAQTQQIRLGSGGVILPHHQPLIIAEQFLMLQGLYPGRVDLGLGRTLGFTDPVRRALRQTSTTVEEFEDDVVELQSYLHCQADVTARPASQTPPPMFILATGGGIHTAAQCGLPLVLGGPVLQSPELAQMLQRYREEFRPSPSAETPQVIISLDIYVAESAEAARRLALPEVYAMARSRETGEFPPLESPEVIEARPWSRLTSRRVYESLERTVAGPVHAVRPILDELIETTGAEEIMASTSTWDFRALAELDTALAELVLS